MQTRGQVGAGREVTLRRLVAGFLRMAPDVAIVGEVRDREALPLLLTLSSGVKGFTTIHAGSARQALTRLASSASWPTGDLPLSALNTLVSEAVDVVVHCAAPRWARGLARSWPSRTWPAVRTPPSSRPRRFSGATPRRSVGVDRAVPRSPLWAGGSPGPAHRRPMPGSWAGSPELGRDFSGLAPASWPVPVLRCSTAR
ncbi:MAG: Flp pilus assembly complex ATPase component TadA [Candidatus Microthrix sp.]|uniref:Flp pilus assembly complex ATPase component TadA n=1 Tax=Candidatus Neomicrothrix subdominans TaxID=2954438 RepID=A0A936TF04_9ACTN|nr:Flp pilus assembly complex ATPase component TadA [Candidatus Microthrix subdominans]